MNPLMLIIIALVALCYCGGKLCPAVLRQNKEMLLGVAIGMALCSFMDIKLEGFGAANLASCTGEREAQCPAYVTACQDEGWLHTGTGNMSMDLCLKEESWENDVWVDPPSEEIINFCRNRHAVCNRFRPGGTSTDQYPTTLSARGRANQGARTRAAAAGK